MCEEIRTVDELVDALGGTTALAQWLDVGKSAVSNWRAEGAIPRGHHLQLYLETQRRGLRVAPHVFGLSGAWAEEFARIERAEPAQATEARPRL